MGQKVNPILLGSYILGYPRSSRRGKKSHCKEQLFSMRHVVHKLAVSLFRRAARFRSKLILP